MKILALSTVFLASGLLLSTTFAFDAEACSPAPESVIWTLPEEGGTTYENGKIFAVTVGIAYSGREVSLTNEEGVEIAGTVEGRPMARLFQSVVEFVPDEALVPGDYLLTIDFPESEWNESEELAFTVNAGIIELSPSGPVEFRWFQETHDTNKGDSCHATKELNQVAVEPLDDAPEYYVITFISADDTETIQMLRPSEADGELKWYMPVDVACVQVAAANADGSTGDLVEHCTPDKCNHISGEGWLDSTDWDDISGCGEDSGEGDTDTDADGEGDGDPDGEDDADTDSDGEGDGDPDGEDDADTDGEGDVDPDGDDDAGGNNGADGEEDIFDDEGTGSCAAAPGSMPGGFLWLIALGAAALVLRR